MSVDMEREILTLKQRILELELEILKLRQMPIMQPAIVPSLPSVPYYPTTPNQPSTPDWPYSPTSPWKPSWTVTCGHAGPRQ